MLLLQVRVVLEGVDKYNNLFGSVVYPEGDKLTNLGEAIMQVRRLRWEELDVGGQCALTMPDCNHAAPQVSM
jgi:hypothetical protein